MADNPTEDAAKATSDAAGAAAEAAAEEVKKDAESVAEAAAPAEAVTDAVASAEAATDTAAAAASDAVSTDAPQQAPVQTIYVQAPQPPKRKGNRGFGILFAFIATIVFALVHAGVSIGLISLFRPQGLNYSVLGFLVSPFFYVPLVVFLVLMILWALLANRAGWWSWVLGSLVIAILVYGISLTVFVLMAGGFGARHEQAGLLWLGFSVNPILIVATILSREAALWFGGAIAKRGRKVRQRNYEAWQAFEKEQAEKRG